MNTSSSNITLPPISSILSLSPNVSSIRNSNCFATPVKKQPNGTNKTSLPPLKLPANHSFSHLLTPFPTPGTVLHTSSLPVCSPSSSFLHSTPSKPKSKSFSTPSTTQTPSKPENKSTNNTTSSDFAFITHSQESFLSNIPDIDNIQLARRKRRRTSPKELTILQNEFRIGSNPNKKRREQIALDLNMTEKSVQIWFQNKRQSLKKLSNPDISKSTTTITASDVSIAVHDDDLSTSTPIKAKVTVLKDITNIPKMKTLKFKSTSNGLHKLDDKVSKQKPTMKVKPILNDKNLLFNTISFVKK